MQIVIDIPDTVWNEAKEYGHLDICGIELSEKVMNGIPLPKGHGRLIDVNRLKKYINGCEFCNNCPKKEFRCEFACTLPDYLTDDIEMVLDAQSTILEATEEVQE